MAVRVKLPQDFHIEEDFENIKIGIEMFEVLAGYNAPFLYAKIIGEDLCIKATAGPIKYEEVSSSLSDTANKLYSELKTKIMEESRKATKGSSQFVLKEEVREIVQRLMKRYLSSCNYQ